MQEPAAASYADGDWQAAFDAVGNGIMILDANLNVLRANCTLATWLGTSLEALTGRPCFELIHKTDAPPEGCPAFYALRSHHEEHVEQEIPSMCGFYRCSAYPLIENGAVKRIVAVVNDVTERKRVDGELRLQTEYLAVLHETALGLIARRELPALLTTIVERAAALLGAPHGFLYLLEPGGGEMELQVGLGAYAAHRGRRLRRGQGLAGHVWQTGRSLVAASDGDDLARDAPGGSARRSRVAVPLLAQGQVAGVLGVAAEVEKGGFHFDEIALLSRFAELASIAVDNARLYEAVQRELAERRQAEESLTARLNRSPTVPEVAAESNLPIETIHEVLEARRMYRPNSLEGRPEGSPDPAVGDIGVTRAVDRMTIEALLERLPERERTILELRFFEELNQSDIAERVGVSQMHVSRLIRRALERLATLVDQTD